ncbi:MAG TPA: cation-transporting P-type ATPase, partial [Coriobacteriia bacterium]
MSDDRRAASRYHVRTANEVIAELGSDADAGLSAHEVLLRHDLFGPNVLRASSRTPPWKLFLGQYNDFMIWVLLAAVAVSAFEGQVVEAVAIGAILLLNGVLGFVQEFRAEKALEALEQMSAPVATVVRDGRESDIPAVELVPGDVVLLEAGDRVPADGRLIEAVVLRMEEAPLTGESVPSSKVVGAVEDPEAALGDRVNSVFAGTSVAVGRGRAIVTATGQATEMGRIADLLDAQEDSKTPLQEELRRVGQVIAVMVLAIAALVFAVEAWRSLSSPEGPSITTAL